MDMPAGPPALGESAPPPPDRPAEVEAGAGAAERDRLLADEVANRRLVATTAAFALLAVAFMLLVFLLTHDGAAPDERPPAAVPARPAPTTPSASTPTTQQAAATIDPDDLERVVAEVRTFVADERGLRFQDEVPVVVLDRTEYEARVGAAFDATADDVSAYLHQHAAVYQALGVWNPGDDPVAEMRALEATSSVGFYDTATGELVMGVPSLSPLFRSTLAHELTHALDDQHFGLDRPELFGRSDEQAAAFDGLVEGDARRVQLAYGATLSDEEQTGAAEELASLTADFDPAEHPDAYLYELGSAYEKGLGFVQALVEDGGNAAIDDAFSDPPTTTEALAVPSSYLRGVTPEEVPVPAADADPIAEGVLGLSILDGLPARAENEERPEWDGDHYVLWNGEGNTVCIRFTVAGDAEAFELWLQPWADDHGAELTVVDDQLQATACN